MSKQVKVTKSDPRQIPEVLTELKRRYPNGVRYE